MIVVRASCPHCAAPLALADGQQQVLCGYCQSSLRLAPAPAGATTLARQQIPAAEIERLKELILAGKHREAVAHYARIAGVTPEAATTAVNGLTWPTVQTLMRHLPINAFGFVLFLSIIGGFVGLAAWAAGRALAGTWWYWLICAPAAAVALRQVWSFLPKLSSTWTASFGPGGRATVLKRAVVRPGLARGGSIVLVAFSVEPASGGAPFVDEEVLFLLDSSIAKLEPGNVVAVRYDEPGRRRVFPISPITVIGSAGQ